MKTPRHSSQPAATWLVGSCLATCAAVWPTVGGWVDVRFAVAVAAIAWIFKGWVCGASASVGLLLGYAFLGSRIGDELSGASLLALLVLGSGDKSIEAGLKALVALIKQNLKVLPPEEFPHLSFLDFSNNSFLRIQLFTESFAACVVWAGHRSPDG